MGRLVRVVQAGRAVAEYEHQAGKPRGHAQLAKHLLRDLRHLVDGVAKMPGLGPRCPIGPLELQAGQRRGPDKPAQRTIEPRRVPREEGARDQGYRSQHADHGCEQCSQGQRPAAHVEPERRHAQGAPRLLAKLVGLFIAVDHPLDDPVPRTDHARAKGYEMRIGRPAIVHRDREEACRAERRRVRSQFLDVAAHRLFALVEAEDRLKPRLAWSRGRVTDMESHSVRGLRVEAPLVGQVEDPPALEPAEGVDFLEDRSPFLFVQAVEDIG